MQETKRTTLSNKQAEVWNMLEGVHESGREIFYGGAAGGGKSWLGCLWQMYRRVEFAGTRGAICRSVLKNLRRTTLKTFQDLWDDYGQHNPYGVTMKFKEAEMMLKFSNGSEILCLDLEFYPSDADFKRLGSLELTDAFVDEAPELTERAVDILQSRIRYKLELVSGNLPKILLAGNPANNWAKYRWIKSKDRDKPFKLRDHQRVVRATLMDNPDPEFRRIYKMQLELLSNADRLRLLEGDWDATELKGGEFYHGFELYKHRGVVEPIPNAPYHLIFDQNVVPYNTCLVAQVVIEANQAIQLRFIDEICLAHPNNKTEDVCNMATRKYLTEGSTVFYYGDASGHKRDTRSGESDYDIIRRVLKPYLVNGSDRTTRVNPPILRRRDFVNDLFQGKYPHSIMVSERCDRLTDDLVYIKQDSNGAKLKEREIDPVTKVSQEKYGHTSDCLDYFCVEILNNDFNKRKNNNK